MLDESLSNMKQTSRQRGMSFFIGITVFVCLVALISGMTIAYTTTAKYRVLPGLVIGKTPVGGLTEQELHDTLQTMYDKLLADGARVTFDTSLLSKPVIVYPIVVAGEESVPVLTIDMEKEIQSILSYGKQGSLMMQMIRNIEARFNTVPYTLQFMTVDEQYVRSVLGDHSKTLAYPPRDARIVIESRYPFQYTVASSSPGVLFDIDTAVSMLRTSWSQLTPPDVTVQHVRQAPSILESDVEKVASDMPRTWSAPLSFVYEDPKTRGQQTWDISPSRIAEWLDVQMVTGTAVVGVDHSLVMEFLERTIVPDVAVEAKNARFDISPEGNVSVFEASQVGRELDATSTYEAINSIVRARFVGEEPSSTIALPVVDIAPEVTTADVNNLGITEVLGIGVSNFANSPANRILNIKNGAKKLNGLLIKPGEEFSTIAATKPYTIEGGYVPELVIKGTKLTPEIGGGLCQIGTTLFRMAMNSAMDITERQNHSLVVSYYNDLQNGNPGTDATIYEPAPDFKFLNDTGHYLLIQTDVREKTGELIFTLWGTSDGRKGSYTPPVVKRWIPYGETRRVETTSLPPGTENCQKAFRGAETSFTYTRTLPDGTSVNRVFESYYRPLPSICLVGVAPSCPEGQSCSSSTSQTSDPSTPADALAPPAPVGST